MMEEQAVSNLLLPYYATIVKGYTNLAWLLTNEAFEKGHKHHI